MHMLKMKSRIALANIASLALLTLVLATVGCVVEKKGAQGNEDVKIATPLGGMHVKTNEAVIASDIGLPVYPGAVAVKKDSDHDNGAADVNMSFGEFHLRVKAVKYQSTDDSAKVRVFYQKALHRFGDVIECQGTKTVGTPAKTSEGLTCGEGGSNHV